MEYTTTEVEEWGEGVEEPSSPYHSRSFQDLLVWQKAHQLVLAIYRETAGFPTEEKFGLVSQLRRSAVSVPANIAEGFARRTPADKGRFYHIAHGSLEETRYYLILAQDLNYAETSALRSEVDEISRMFTAYIKKLSS